MISPFHTSVSRWNIQETNEAGSRNTYVYIDSRYLFRLEMVIYDFIELFDNRFIRFITCNELAFVETDTVIQQ